ncbi:polysaccharide export protein [Henriciella barbarensis]|uniref:Polysaccharide export protein n=1 Tax=Henriciella barbarensis TaxID=86342 RepID=A0A399QNG5_9PROT|nr:polysaccharide biosynthesis/export family protein [Henriciella barbarensis]RIJ20483.1 polysaccharide export protein [Henriciella barbarensis]
MKPFLSWLAVAVSIAAAGCGGNQPAANSGQILPAPDRTIVAEIGELEIAPGDSVQVKVFGVNELNGTYEVDHRGRIKMPLIGEVDALGNTALQLAGVLEAKLEDDYLQDADVTVTLQQSRIERVTVDGSIKNPGMVQVTGEMGLLQVVAMAGGPTEGANPKNVVVFRQVGGEQVAASYNLTAIRNGKAENPRVFGNDIIVVDGSEARRARTELLRTIPLLSFFLIF